MLFLKSLKMTKKQKKNKNYRYKTSEKALIPVFLSESYYSLFVFK